MPTLRTTAPFITKLSPKKIWTKLCGSKPTVFNNLKFSEEQYKTEAGAVLGEYNKNSASRRLLRCMKSCAKRLSANTPTATRRWVISKTSRIIRINTIMRGNFSNVFTVPKIRRLSSSAISMKRKYSAMVKKYYGDWKSGDYKQKIPTEPAQNEARKQTYRMGFANTAVCRRRLSRSGFFRNRKGQSRARSAEC